MVGAIYKKFWMYSEQILCFLIEYESSILSQQYKLHKQQNIKSYE